MTRIVGDDLRRFESYVEREPANGCWLWIGAADRYGYGRFWLNGRLMKAHRASWILHRGAIPEGQWLLHGCDVPCCVNPAHLSLGDRTDNMRDMAAKGRQVFQVTPSKAARGSRVAGSKLSESQVVAIKGELRAGRSLSAIAADYGVNKSAVSHIKTGRNWSHLS